MHCNQYLCSSCHVLGIVQILYRDYSRAQQPYRLGGIIIIIVLLF